MPDTTTLPEVAYGLTVSGDTSWEVVRVHLSESLSGLYDCALEIARDGDCDPRGDLLGERCVLTVQRGETTTRLCGIVCSVLDRGWVSRRRVAEVRVVPAMWLLGQRVTWRIYQELHAIEVVERVLADAALYQGEGLVKRLGDLVPGAREYCTQYGESDLDFVRRLLEEEGVTFHFDHAGETEKLVLTNGAQADIFPPLELGGPVPVMGEGGATSGRETVRALERHDRVVHSGVRLRDYDFTHPAAVLDQQRGGADAIGTRQRMEYPARATLGPYAGKVYGESDIRRLALTREQEVNAGAIVFYGRSNVTALRPGNVVEVVREDGDRPESLLVVRVTHVGEAPEVLHLDETAGGSKDDRYENSFECIPSWAAWRPPRVTVKPRAMTPQSAVVVPEPKTSTDTICTDAHGRVKLRFQWDRPAERTGSQAAKNASCWVRVQQTWAGNGWGFVFLPRVGMEVLVQFLDADPDRPVVTGCLYNGAHATPEKLPDTKTKSVLRTQSTPGEGYNELHFEDEGGKEVLHLRAQRDMTELALNDHKVDYQHDEVGNVGNDQTWTVGNNRAVTVKADDTLTVEKNRAVTVNENDTLEVTKNLAVTVWEASTLTVSKTHVMAIDEGMTVKVGGNAGTRLEMKPGSITLQCSGSSLEITASAITLTQGASKVTLDASSVSAESVTVAANGNGELTLKSGGIATLQGSLVKIN